MDERRFGAAVPFAHTRTAPGSGRAHAGGAIQPDPALIAVFGQMMREHLTTGSIPFRKAYLQSLIEVIEFDDAQIRIVVSKDVLEKQF
jgi:hypothetical protein